jgi:hypothetical protein
MLRWVDSVRETLTASGRACLLPRVLGDARRNARSPTRSARRRTAYAADGPVRALLDGLSQSHSDEARREDRTAEGEGDR